MGAGEGMGEGRESEGEGAGKFCVGAGGPGIVNPVVRSCIAQADMPRLVLLPTLLLVLAGLASCSSQSFATKIDDRTYKIEGPEVPGGAEAPNRRLAERVCPGGYRVLDSTRTKEGCSDGCSAGISTNWVIRCL